MHCFITHPHWDLSFNCCIANTGSTATNVQTLLWATHFYKCWLIYSTWNSVSCTFILNVFHMEQLYQQYHLIQHCAIYLCHRRLAICKEKQIYKLKKCTFITRWKSPWFNTIVSVINNNRLLVFIYIQRNTIQLKNTVHTLCISKCKYSYMITREKYSENNSITADR